jgi:dihydroorotate dehydrogenase (NAD+) catalytic subunit
MGGITSTEDALEFFMAGAAAIQVGTATFPRPTTMTEIIEGLEQFMKTEGITHLSELSLQDQD